ncbi:helix-turn-helix transcriptional regulator [Leptolyngbya sp. NK1-12]|uniref:Helix-turn-helix transcriptional regulator n=1 Tax=Leptolyngbya sp. NK1-12 TaxID=2547451 RepID=A0AA96WDF0_9CYAN|nr:AraC family transcriptional regulator [Leptolyngbya sp. NK1-12]WNZ22505.1 helix-turn-helix transcriptional regulator [Leptolyngbya sp. NK1-12]
MTISLSQQSYTDFEQALYAQAQYPDSADGMDLLLQQPAWFATGYTREVELRQGLRLQILDFRLCDRCETTLPDQEGAISFHFHLSGEHQDACTEVSNLEYALYGSGLAPKHTLISPDRYPALEVIVDMEPESFVSFIGQGGELPLEFQHLIQPADQTHYTRVGTISPAMQGILWQIIRCPYLGLHKRMYLEGKALEVAALVLEEEREVQQGRQPLLSLKSDCVDRIHRAREILMQNLHQPPSLMELARQVGLNDYSLKCGFKQVFGKTVFGYLHDYRMEQASQLLMSGEMKVEEVAAAIGFESRSYFSIAFRKKFGITPKTYQMQCRTGGRQI